MGIVCGIKWEEKKKKKKDKQEKFQTAVYEISTKLGEYTVLHP